MTLLRRNLLLTREILTKADLEATRFHTARGFSSQQVRSRHAPPQLGSSFAMKHAQAALKDGGAVYAADAAVVL